MVPAQPKVFHITHVDNLPSIAKGSFVLSDALMVAHGGPAVAIGMSTIKLRRLNQIVVTPHAGTHVGDYVPFYFCPRSVMLYLLHKGNHPEITYKGGQDSIVHLVADLAAVIDWANAKGVQWAFSLSNAGAYYVKFRADVAALNQIDWLAVANPDFRDPTVKEGKQAEFLLSGKFPWELVSRIGVRTAQLHLQVSQAIAGAAHQPPIDILPNWYY
jgi:hypothetical protein